MRQRRRRLDQLLSEVTGGDNPELALGAMIAERLGEIEDRMDRELIPRPPDNHARLHIQRFVQWILGLLSAGVIALVIAVLHHESEIAVLKSNEFTEADGVRHDGELRGLRELVEAQRRRIQRLEDAGDQGRP